jgi:hypothetical protein
MPKSNASSAAIIVERSTTTETTIPAEADLRRYFSSQGHSGTQLDEDVRVFTRRVLSRSDQMLKHAAAIKRLAQQFSQNDLQSMDDETRTKFLSLLHGHAQALEQQIVNLQREFSSAFSLSALSAPSVSSVADLNDNQQFVRAAEQLFDLCAFNDRSIRSAFTISPDVSNGLAIKSSEFFRSMASAKSLAVEINKR